MAPKIPTWSTSDLSSETFFDANSEVVIFIFHTWVLWHVLFYVLGGGDLVIDLGVVARIWYQLDVVSW